LQVALIPEVAGWAHEAPILLQSKYTGLPAAESLMLSPSQIPLQTTGSSEKSSPPQHALNSLHPLALAQPRR